MRPPLSTCLILAPMTVAWAGVALAWTPPDPSPWSSHGTSPMPLLSQAAAPASSTTPVLSPATVPPVAGGSGPSGPSNAPVTPLGSLVDAPVVRVQGRVVEHYGNKIILEDSSGRMLVELGREGADRAAPVIGQTWTVEGRFHGGFVHATSVTLPDGRIARLEGPGPRGPKHEDGRGPGKGPGKGPEKGPGKGEANREGRGAPDAAYDPAVVLAGATRAGYLDPAIIDVKGRHAELAARNAAGQAVSLHVEFDGRIRKEEVTAPPMAESEVRSVLERAGYTLAGPMTPFKKHMIVTARNSRGEAVQVDVHRDGTIKRERTVQP